jgi:hypothetical protein
MQLPNRADAYAGGFHDSIDSNFTVCTDRIGWRVLVNRHHVGPLSRVGPHEHHWQAVLWWCRGCGAFDEE